jgi:hypothetical protein
VPIRGVGIVSVAIPPIVDHGGKRGDRLLLVIG